MIEVYYKKIEDLDETIVDNEFLLKRINDTNDESYKNFNLRYDMRLFGVCRRCLHR